MESKKAADANGGLTLIKKTSSTSLTKRETKRKARIEVDLLPYPLTDSGNAERLVALFGQDICYCPDFGCWMVWDERRWKRDSVGRVQRMAKETARTLYAQSMRIEDIKARDKVGGFARHSENAAGIRAMLECARSVEDISVVSEEFDPDPWKFNCLNGTIDLKTGELEEHNRSDLITKMCPVAFDANAICPEFDRFLHLVFEAKLDLIIYFQRAMGYSLTGDVGEKALFCLVGDGNNGKTTLMEGFRYVFGDYAGQIMIDSLLQKSNNSSSAALADLADLKGKRLIITSEAEQGAKLAEAQVKQLTGMGHCKACRKYANPTEFSPTWKIFMDSNHQPVVRGRDAGIWNRLKLINFRVSIPKEQIDKHFLSKLKKEASGLLNWAVRGCLDWQRNGLQEPGTVQDAVLGWKAESDQLKGFFDLICELNPLLRCPAEALQKAFEKFKRDKKLAMTYQQVTGELKKLGCKQGRSKNVRYWRGIGLRVQVTG